MKKLFSILTIALVTMCALSLSSCSKDDDNEGSKITTSDVVGTWMTTSVQTNGTWVDLTDDAHKNERAYAKFKADGTYEGWGSLGNGNGTWKLSGNTLTTYVNGIVYITYKNIVLNGTEMSGTMDLKETLVNFKAKKQ